MSFVDSIFDQTFKRHPYLFLFVLICCGAVLGHSYNVFAQETKINERLGAYELSVDSRFNTLDAKIGDLGNSVATQFTQQTIRQLSSEIYDLSNIIAAGNANSRDHRRLKDLRDALKIEENNLDKLGEHTPVNGHPHWN